MSIAKESNPAQYNPPVFFWIAHYEGGQCLPQFDPVDGHENLFRDIDQKQLVKFGWYPFTDDLRKVMSINASVNPFLPRIELEIGAGQRLIAFREQKIHHGSAHLCLKCGCMWQQRDASQGATELELPISNKWFEAFDKSRRRYVAAVCPKCGSYTIHVCPNCQIERTKYADGFRCAECKIPCPDMTRRIPLEKRLTTYVLGWQETLEGRNRKILIRIDELGNVIAHQD